MTNAPTVPSATMLWDCLAPDRLGSGVGRFDQELRRLLTLLHSSNREQWDTEDAARRAPTDSHLAKAKRSIDRRNRYRVELIDGINAEFLKILPTTASAPPLTSEPGATCDRLSVTRLRIDAAARTVSSAAEVRRLAEVRRSAEGLIAALDADILDVLAGRRSLSALPTHKIYA